jgi:hemolysin D
MAQLTLRNSDKANAIALPALLEFHSPTAALTIAPVLRGARGTIWVVCSLAAACIGAAALIPIDKVVTSQGKVVAQSATSVVQPLETAIIRSIDVKEGQVVHKGDVLARLDPTFATADAAALESQVASLTAEVERLQAEASGKTYTPKDASPLAVLQGAIFLQHQAERSFKNENYNQKINSLQSQIQRAVADKDAYFERLKVAEELERKRIELERLQVGSQINRLAATDSRLEVKRGLSNATNQVEQAARDLQAMQAERDGYNQQWRGQVSQDLTDQGRKLSDAKENLNKADLRRQLVEVRAEQDSVVNNIAKVSPGSVLQSGEQFLTLVPVDSPYEVEANIAGMDAGFVHPGNTVTVKFDTFPFTQYGAAEGTVRVVSADSFSSNPDEKQRGIQQASPGNNAQTFYRARISLDEVKLHGTPPGFRLNQGMPITADIKVGERTVVGYLLSRVLPVAMNGMREP